MDRQTDRAVSTTRTGSRSLSGAMIGSLCLHGLAIVLVIGAMSPKGAALDEAAVVTIVVDPSAQATASAGTVSPSAPPGEAAAGPERDTGAAAKANPQPRALEDSIPPPVQETLAVPDLHPPPPVPKEEPEATSVMPRSTEVARDPEPRPETPPAPAPPVAALEDSVPSPVQEALTVPDLRPIPPPREEAVARLENAVPPPTSESLAVPEFRPPLNPKSPTAQKPVVAPRPQGSRPVTTAKPEPSRVPAPTQRDAPTMGASNRENTTTAPATSSLAPQSSTASPQAVVAPNWNALLSAWLVANRRYPETSRRRGEEGEVAVRFTVAPNGRVLDATLTKASGFPELDAAALAMLRNATLPAPGVEATRSVRVRYRLND